MSTVNNRIKLLYANVINGIDAGGAMQANIQAGYERNLASPADGLQIPLRDRAVEFVRGTITTQDWVRALELLTGTLGTGVFYQRNSGVVAATGYTKHTITNPVIHSIALQFDKDQFSGCTYAFECKAADETKGIIDMHVPLEGQAVPSYISAARGGYRTTTAVHGSTSIFHMLKTEFRLALPLDKACNDGDVGYTCVDASLDGIQAGGSLSFEDASIASSKFKAVQLLTAAADTLVLTVQQSQAATSKTCTIAGVDFSSARLVAAAQRGFSAHSLDYDITNNIDTQLTLAGANPIIAIANVI